MAATYAFARAWWTKTTRRHQSLGLSLTDFSPARCHVQHVALKVESGLDACPESFEVCRTHEDHCSATFRNMFGFACQVCCARPTNASASLQTQLTRKGQEKKHHPREILCGRAASTRTAVAVIGWPWHYANVGDNNKSLDSPPTADNCKPKVLTELIISGPAMSV